MSSINDVSSESLHTVHASSPGSGADEPTFYSRYFKRGVDIILALAVLPIFLPLVLGLAVAIFLSDRRNPFFAHKRVGQNGRTFGCLKLRTMVVDAEELLPQLLEGSPERQQEWNESQKLADDPRITKLGSFLRRTSLDELPQLVNVLRGDMSLVGPRPIVPNELSRYGRHAATYLRLKPGVTGMWQTSGRNDVSYVERVHMDVEYGQNILFWMDMKIMALTVLAILHKTGR